MRREMTEPEICLWFALRAKRFAGVKFRKHKVIGGYIADFASRNPMLIIELDGGSHAGRQDYDAVRTRYLEGQGYKVVRFLNSDVMANLEGVLEALAVVVDSPPLPTLSPKGERAT